MALMPIPLGRYGQPEDVAGAHLLLASDEADIVSGVVLRVSGRRLARDEEDRVALNQALKGKTYRELELELDRDGVNRFALAVGEDDPRFTDPEAARVEGYPDQLAFPTFPTVLGILASAQVVVDPELGMDYSRVVHGEQSFDWRRPLVVGDRLRTVPRIADVFVKGPNEFLVIEAEITDGDGEVVCVARSTLLSRGTAGA
jgi:acyl dehydratase